MNITIQGLSKTYSNKQALNDIQLEIKGSFGLLGPNGAGKTTLMRILATLLQPDKGTISCGSVTWDNPNEIRSLLGYLPQHFSMYHNVKVVEVLDHFAVLKGIQDKKTRKSVVDEILEEVNLTGHREKKIKSLSGGMLRRVGIAQALIGNPTILIVDEPTAGLDIEERVRFRKLLRKISKDRIIIISTHIVEDIETICDHVALMKAGQVLVSGTRLEISSSVSGKVWQRTMSAEELAAFPEEEIISTKEAGDGYLIRYFSDVAGEEAVIPTIEDAYLYQMKARNAHV